MRYDWSPRASFETIDANRNYFLNADEIRSFCRVNGFFATESEVIAIIRRLDIDADQKVTYDEWVEAVRPQGTALVSSTRFEEEKKSPFRESKLDSSDARYSSPSKLGSSSLGGKRQSPLKVDDEQELVRAFKEQISLETEIEDAKVRLAQQPDFNMSDAFSMMDRNSNGYVSVDEIIDTLQLLGVYAPREDVVLFVKRYDRNLDNKLRFSEFCDAFVPKNALHASTLNARKANYLPLGYPRTEYFMRDTRDLYVRTLKLHFNLE